MKHSWRNIRLGDVLRFLLFVGLAAAVWYGHAMHSVRNTRVPVSIQYTGKPGNIGIGDAGLPDTIMIEVRDAGSRLNTYHREPLRLTIDLHSYIHGEKGTIHVPSDALRRSISDILQGTSSLISIQPEEIRCSYFTEQEKTVAVVFDGELSLADEYQMVGAPTLSRNKIKLYGQDKALAAVDTIFTEHVVWDEICDTLSQTLRLAVPRGMRTETDSVTVTIISERFTEKKFLLPIQAKDAPSGYRLRLFPKEVEVSVRVGMSHFAQVQPEDIKVVCVYEPDRTDKLDVELHYSNPYITSAWAYPGVVEFILEQ